MEDVGGVTASGVATAGAIGNPITRAHCSAEWEWIVNPWLTFSGRGARYPLLRPSKPVAAA
jgi:hypothetical protein